MKLRKRMLVILLSLGILSSTLGTFAYAAMNHPVNPQKYSQISGTFVDDSGMFTITSRVADGAGLFVFPIALVANATSPTTAANLLTDTRITDDVNPGDWVIDLTLTNSTDLPTHAVWSITFQSGSDGTKFGVFTSASVHYLCTCNPAVPGNFIILTFDLGTNLVTPFAYYVIVQRVS